MRILVLNRDHTVMAAIESALRVGDVKLVSATPGEALPLRRYAFAGWTLDAATREILSPGGSPIELTSSEFELLMAFVEAPGQPLSRTALLAALRGRAWSYFDRSIDTLVARLRKKIGGNRQRTPLIRSVRGVGYVFCANVTAH